MQMLTVLDSPGAAGALREDVDRLARPPSDADEARIMRRFRKYLLEKNPEIADVEELDPEKVVIVPRTSKLTGSGLRALRRH